MSKTHIAAIAVLSIAFAASGVALAQQTPAPVAPAKPAPAASGAQSSTTAKTGAGTAAKKPAAAASPLVTPKQKASYAIGMNIGKNLGTGLKNDGVDVDAASLARGVRDAVAGNKTLMTEDEAKAALTALATDVKAKQQVKLAAVGAVNKKAGDDFLAANKTKEGVVTLPSGLQYKILKAGTGPKPALTDRVTCNYSGSLLEGKEFDNSYKRGEPVTFALDQVIPAWKEALQLMPVGSKWQLFVPPDLGYGAPGKPPVIGPSSTLLFEVELLSIAPKTEAKPAADPSAKPELKPEAVPDAKPEVKPPSKPEAKPNSN
ncbi:MAG TPA: FKBP-type peptidyl-prolyl cis-trans isomerase [Candidatus Acidoferrum sp.]|jgi:FKBP-type peptidyl-prolyl cis-trans isomerase